MQPFTGTVLHFFNAFPPSSPRHLSGGISPSQISWFFSNRISQDHISDLLTGISSVFSSSLLVAILLCWLSFISPLYLHLLILASRNASNCACSLTFRWGFESMADNRLHAQCAQVSGMNYHWIITCPDKASPLRFSCLVTEGECSSLVAQEKAWGWGLVEIIMNTVRWPHLYYVSVLGPSTAGSSSHYTPPPALQHSRNHKYKIEKG